MARLDTFRRKNWGGKLKKETKFFFFWDGMSAPPATQTPPPPSLMLPFIIPIYNCPYCRITYHKLEPLITFRPRQTLSFLTYSHQGWWGGGKPLTRNDHNPRFMLNWMHYVLFTPRLYISWFPPILCLHIPTILLAFTSPLSSLRGNKKKKEN